MAISVKDSNGKRLIGSFNFPGNFEVKKEGPLDTRAVVGSIDDLLDTINSEGESKYQYFGMLVSVSGDADSANDGVYRLLEGGDPTQLDGWEKLGTGTGSGSDTFVKEGVLDNSILTLSYNDGTTPITIDFGECCGGTGSGELYDSEFEIPTVETVGGIDSGTPIADLEGKTFSQIFDLMFFPTQTPTNSGPSTGLVLDGLGTIYEIGETFDVTFNTTAAGGGWSPATYAGGVVQPSTYAGVVNNAVITYAGAGVSPTVDGVSLTLNGAYDIEDPIETSYKVVAGENKWTLTTSFDSGEEPYDSTNELISGANYPGGDKTSSDAFQGTYPIYVINEDGTFTQLPLVPLTTNPVTLGINFAGTAPGAATFEFRIPKAFGTPTNISQLDPFGSWGTTNQLGAYWELNTITINTDHDSNVEYHQFVHKSDETGAIGASEFKITI